MAVFNKLYAEYYDLMYAGKDYGAEVKFFDSLLRKFGLKNGKDLLSLGAGTLNHEVYLLKKGYVIHGVDISEDMVRLAKEKISHNNFKGIEVEKADMMNLDMKGRKFDAVLSMFNVVSYCKGMPELNKVIASASKSLKTGGVLIFDCWNVDAVRKDPPRNPWVKYEKDGKSLYRLTQAKFDQKKGSIDRFVEMIELKDGKLSSYETESHLLYSWDLALIKKSLEKNGMKLVKSCQFMNANKPVSNKNWNMTIVAKKIK